MDYLSIRGTYRQLPCAIKLVYTMDLTEEVIQRVAAEATILSSMKVKARFHPICMLPWHTMACHLLPLVLLQIFLQ
jgi:hypothetical protein